VTSFALGLSRSGVACTWGENCSFIVMALKANRKQRPDSHSAPKHNSNFIMRRAGLRSIFSP
jgi:hypothetical protein